MYIVIAGCSNVGSTLASILSDMGHDVAVIERDPKFIKNLGTGFNGIVVEGVPIDEDILLKAGIEDADVFAAVTRDENVNIMAAQIAKNIFGVNKVIARVLTPAKNAFFNEIGIDTVCQTDLCVQYIRKFIFENGIKYIAKISKYIDVVEFSVKKIPDDNRLHALLANGVFNLNAVKRGDIYLIPDSNFEINKEDILICTVDNRYIDTIKTVFGL
ncbi:trk system potassium uptake protein TrkA [Caldanaerobius fijiensis DSM 17918]|uniref:Trk system potassium uptake protein TrkA n=1 Tax=Caldanaerobius fijiensis DSM 17918 TaxID=1121256 RepID=A0A1M5FFR6_9THEO|nr:TrkA family potassium uptake protein [Caldanaerobius fijiensis]SHF90336.1 trk system potassium uptake protein TrkA [Caldanaerobius fijiensis DSM 17918]